MPDRTVMPFTFLFILRHSEYSESFSPTTKVRQPIALAANTKKRTILPCQKRNTSLYAISRIDQNHTSKDLCGKQEHVNNPHSSHLQPMAKYLKKALMMMMMMMMIIVLLFAEFRRALCVVGVALCVCVCVVVVYTVLGFRYSFFFVFVGCLSHTNDNGLSLSQSLSLNLEHFR
jgi:hypothetical protein